MAIVPRDQFLPLIWAIPRFKFNAQNKAAIADSSKIPWFFDDHIFFKGFARNPFIGAHNVLILGLL